MDPITAMTLFEKLYFPTISGASTLTSAVLAVAGVMIGVKLVQLAVRKVRGAVK